MARLHEAAGSSERITDCFYRVLNMLEPASTLFGPDVLKDMLRATSKRARQAGLASLQRS